MSYAVACLVVLIVLDGALTYAALRTGALELNHLLRFLIKRWGAEVLVLTHGALCVAALMTAWTDIQLGIVMGFYLHAVARNIREMMR
jgi:hypothetical protein